MPDQAKLRVLTFPHKPHPDLVVLDNTIPCDSSLTCACLGCHLDRQRLVRRGVRPSQPIPIVKRKAA